MYNESCQLVSACDESLGLVCIQQKCQCHRNSFYNGNTCGQFMKLLLRFFVGLELWTNLNKLTERKRNNDQTCTSSIMCNSIVGLTCINGKCSCNASALFDGNKCVKKAGFQDSCSLASPCDTSLGLVCSDGVCMCPATHYYNNKLCGKLHAINK